MTQATNKINDTVSFDVIDIKQVTVEGDMGDIAYDVTIVETRNGVMVSTITDRFIGNSDGTPGKVMSLMEGDKKAVTVSQPERFGTTFDRSWVENFEEVKSVELNGELSYINL